MKQYKHYLLLVPLSIFLCGFTKIIEWGKENFKQASVYNQKFLTAVEPYLKSGIAYEQLTNVATFDALLLNDDVRMLYVDYFAVGHALSDDSISVMRERQKNENLYFISFYVLVEQKEHDYVDNKALFTGEYQKATEILHGKDPMWSTTMIVGGKQYAPESIKKVDLPVEYRQFFGRDYSQFKTIYLVRFSAMDRAGRLIIPQDRPSTIMLCFASARHQMYLSWPMVAYYNKK